MRLRITSLRITLLRITSLRILPYGIRNTRHASHPTFLPIMNLRQRPQSFGRLFRRQVALGFGEHLVAHHELFHRCGAQERWVKVGVKLPVLATIPAFT